MSKTPNKNEDTKLVGDVVARFLEDLPASNVTRDNLLEKTGNVCKQLAAAVEANQKLTVEVQTLSRALAVQLTK